jgi:hypothetical protein
MNEDSTRADLQLNCRGAALTIFVHIAALFAGFTVLSIVFGFPEVLRLPAAERLELYRNEQWIVQPIYWVLAMTGLTQIAITLFLHQCFRRRGRSVLLFALVAGILCGILQTAGFIRWAILMPYLAEKIAKADPVTAQIITIVEGAFNRYAGMALGEHTANICLGAWTALVAVAMLKDRLFDNILAYWGVGLGGLAMLFALEQLDIAPVLLSVVMEIGFPAWAVWLIMVAISLLRSDMQTGEGPKLGWGTGLVAIVLYLAMVLPTIL